MVSTKPTKGKELVFKVFILRLNFLLLSSVWTHVFGHFNAQRSASKGGVKFCVYYTMHIAIMSNSLVLLGLEGACLICLIFSKIAIFFSKQERPRRVSLRQYKMLQYPYTVSAHMVLDRGTQPIFDNIKRCVTIAELWIILQIPK